MTVAASTGLAALHDLRRRRRVRRLGRLEWFDVAYKAYLVVIFGGGAVLWASAAIDEAPVTSSLADVERLAPVVVSIVAAVAVLVGARTGARGGPLSIEAADVRHVLLAPVPRRAVLVRPAMQRLRTAVVGAGTVGAVAGQLAGRRLPGSVWSWGVCGGLAGALTGAAWLGAALVAHRRSRAMVTSIGAVLVAAEVAPLWWRVPTPLTGVGHLALAGWPGHLDGGELQRVLAAVVVTVVVAVVVAVGLAMLDSMSLEALMRRSALVAQLRFAATMQDLRTVVLLRRELDEEHPRSVPWRRLPPAGAGDVRLTTTVVRRDLAGLLRFPLARLVRMAALAVALGASSAAVLRGTTSALVLAALAAFVLGLEALEPLSQEIDQPDRAESVPVARGDLLVRHLLAPALVLAPLSFVASAVALVVVAADAGDDSSSAAGSAVIAALVLAVPLVFGGVCGAVVSIVRDAPDPVVQSSGRSAVAMPEMTGLGSVLKAVWPVVVSGAGGATVLFVRAAWRNGGSLVGASLRAAVAALLLVGIVAYWVRGRDRWRLAARRFVEEGRAVSGTRREGVA